jgi:hypothetical protein
MAAYALLLKAFCLKTIVLPIVKLTDISIGSTAADPGVIDASGGGDGGGVTNPVENASAPASGTAIANGDGGGGGDFAGAPGTTLVGAGTAGDKRF